MKPYFIAAALIWSVVLLFASRSAFAAAFLKSERRGDPMRLATWLVALVMVCGSLRWILLPDNETLWKAVWVVASITGFYVLRLMIAYGRGPEVGPRFASEDENGG